MAPLAYASGLAGKNYDHAYPRMTAEKCVKDESIDKTVRLWDLR